MNESMDIQVWAEGTPNPHTLKFNVNRTLLESGSLNYTDKERAKESLLASELFGIEAVLGVLIGAQFVTVTRRPGTDWGALVPQVAEKIKALLASEKELFPKPQVFAQPSASGGTIEQKIQDVLDNEIRPAVAMDGGDVIFHGYRDGVVTLYLQGSCSSCPSSIMTLKMGIENRLKSLIPEIKEVVQV
ncbi:MAG: NifU family protein [Candidatus Omnitrophica bacterium]|nr:NifU family protein [Candidatus Omnitrophota bacterium]